MGFKAYFNYTIPTNIIIIVIIAIIIITIIITTIIIIIIIWCDERDSARWKLTAFRGVLPVINNKLHSKPYLWTRREENSLLHLLESFWLLHLRKPYKPC